MNPPPFAPWQIDLLDELRVARLGTVGANGVPHLVPVCYAFAAGRIVIPVDEKPKSSRDLARLRNIKRDPRVSILFDRYEDVWTRLAWVRAEGEATVLERGDSDTPALEALRRRYHQYQAMDLESSSLISIVPTRVTAWQWTT